ncbi:MAG TPA: DUF5995 family protein [Phaeodactylibacter sp.]|nr:DUF5995 family protein [Phaeodactylibacter sp.]
MTVKEPQTIDEVIAALEAIIQDCQERNDPLGYFAALYHRVTVKVKEGIAEGFFDDGERMEQLDVVFAKRYLEAYHAFRRQAPTTLAWDKAFQLAPEYWPIVLQHLLMGINAHINLDLGIAAAEVSKGKDIRVLQADFNRINEVLSGLVHEVQHNLSVIWFPLRKILQWARDTDDLVVDFSMKIARDGAWRFALALAALPEERWPAVTEARDRKVADKTRLVTSPGRVIQFGLRLVRLGERGTVGEKIEVLCRLPKA